ncbi:MAG: phospho-sugar mutase [Oscillospiraceae bacterium]|nr:phospho-sugar mutase [Oscillospiraceae bacterium]
MDYRKEYEKWLHSSALSADEKAELEAIAQDDKEIESRFFDQLSFGTAGLRGTMGVGLYRMNAHVIRHATQSFAEVILEQGAEAVARGVALCYDCRNNSDLFAREAACVLAGNGIPVRLFAALRPTPMVSFAVRKYGCIAGINITASHNPKEYNGYKVYWEDGAQLPPEHADEVAKKMRELDVFACVKTMDYDAALAEGKIVLMGEETDEAFLANVMTQVTNKAVVEKVADDFKMVFTPFHGTGYQLIPEVLKRLGMKHVICVPQQMVIDGDFPTVVSPNPENPEGFYLAVDIAKAEGADFILGSDPDADRVGIMVNTGNGEFKVLTGNQIGILLVDYTIGAWKRAGRMPANPAVLKSIVSTEMARKVAESNGVACYDTFTGFKFLAQKKDQLEASGEGNVLMAFEESNGYMYGDYVRDKDAVTAALVLTEMAAWYADQGMTLNDAMESLYKKYGFYGEKTLNLVMPGLDGLRKMAQLMADLRAKPPVEIAGVAVKEQKDYSDGSVVCVECGKKTTMELSGSNVLRYEMADGTSIIVRPSGTEPKVKVYILTLGADEAERDANIAKYAAWAATLAE